MKTQPFTYTPLNNQDKEIRLLTLLPGDRNDSILCQITTHSLLSCLAYNALSYVWGDATTSSDPRNTVLLDNQSFSVTANLLSALHHLRPPAAGEAVTLWVDAICINQADLDERNQQVAIMRDIYATAERVIIWLGEDDEYTSNGVFDKIQKVQELQLLAQADELAGTRLQLMHECADFYFTLADVRPWFSRVWILQELALAKNDPLVVCGQRSVSWFTLVEVWNITAKAVMAGMGRGFFRSQSVKKQESLLAQNDVKEAEQITEEEPERLAKVKLDVLDELLHSRRKNGGETFRRLLILSRTSQASNPKDRVYALLGLLSPTETSAPNSITIPIDYRKPTWEVYSDAVSHIFSRGEGPYFLSGIHLPGICNPDGLPSWVPDLSHQNAETATKPSGMQFHPPAGIMSASGAGAECMNGHRLADKRTLRVEGLLIDVIEEVTALGTSLGELVHRLAHLQAVATAAKERPYSRPGTRPEACVLMDTFKRSEPFWKMMVYSKRWMSGYDLAPDAYEEMHRRLLENHDHPWGDEYKAENEYELSLKQGVDSRVLFTTKGGLVGTCIADGCPGDVLGLWFGSPVPFVLRKTGDRVLVDGVEKETYVLIGASYVSGMMGGEMVDELFCEDLVDSVSFYIQ